MEAINLDSPQFLAIKQVLNALASPNDDELSKFLQHFKPRQLKQGDYFVRAGVKSGELGFINAGLVRFFYQTPDGKEFNKSFVAENQFIAAYSSFLTQSDPRYSIQALEDCFLLVADLRAVVALFEESRCWERLGRIFAEQLFIKKESREAEFLLDDAKTRYQTFQQNFGELEDRLPQYHIASFLGITPVALSRIRTQADKN